MAPWCWNSSLGISNSDDCELTVPEAGDRLKLGIIDPAARQDVLADMDADHLAEHHIQRKTRLG